MKKLFLTALLSFSLFGSSFFDIYNQNRKQNRANFITADFIADSFLMYKQIHWSMIEKTILKPRLLNFANFILTGLEEYEKSGIDLQK